MNDEKRYVMELNQEVYVELLKLALNNSGNEHAPGISLITRTCLIYAKEISATEARRPAADVWDEGWSAHYAELEHQRTDPSHPITANNPYEGKS